MREIFDRRQLDFEKSARKFKDKGRMVSLLRLIFFLIAAVSTILLLKESSYAIAVGALALSFIIFGLLVNHHKRINYQFQYYKRLSEINGNEIRRLDIDIDDFEEGSEYLSESHPFAYDLDIFGKHSLYQLINRAETPNGKDLVAADLKSHFEEESILKRQEAIKELKDNIDWRQRLQALALQNKGFGKETFTSLVKWLKSAPVIKTSTRNRIALYGYWLIFLIVLYFIISGAISFVWIFAFNVISVIVLGPRFKYLNDLTKTMQKANELLQAKKNMILHLEKSELQSSWLKNLQTSFFHQDMKASGQIVSLSKIVDHLNNRANLAYGILNSFLLLDIYVLLKVERWKERNQELFEGWFEALAGFESINSFAGFAYANPDFSFPEINNDYVLQGGDIGHPLIPPRQLVKNDFKLTRRGTVALITGSNMAGKSTFLRTMGINLVLAQSGSPVCASSFSFYPCKVFSSMRTKDNLEESVSTFYAELLRIRELLNNISRERPTFYLLDEILKGTNSRDRHEGASALIKQLSKSNSFGLVSTHDLELNQLEQEIDNFENYSFHSEVKGVDIEFDYKIKEGPCKTFNAIALMKRMGIAIS